MQFRIIQFSQQYLMSLAFHSEQIFQFCIYLLLLYLFLPHTHIHMKECPGKRIIVDCKVTIVVLNTICSRFPILLDWLTELVARYMIQYISPNNEISSLLKAGRIDIDKMIHSTRSINFVCW